MPQRKLDRRAASGRERHDRQRLDAQVVEERRERISLRSWRAIGEERRTEEPETRRGDHSVSARHVHAPRSDAEVIAAQDAVHDEHWRSLTRLGIFDPAEGVSITPRSKAASCSWSRRRSRRYLATAAARTAGPPSIHTDRAGLM
jgi:hypothetical protein